MIHTGLTSARWRQFNIYEQLANVGMDVFRAILWREKGRLDLSEKAFFRALELLSLTIDDPKNHGAKLKELCRLYEVLVDYFAGDNIYGSSDKLWEKYFFGYNYAAQLQKGK